MGPGSVLGGLTPNVRGPSTVLEGPDAVFGGGARPPVATCLSYKLDLDGSP